jgi:phospholipid-binding lipoprotein MlaA
MPLKITFMTNIRVILVFLCIGLSQAKAQEDAGSYTNDNLHPGQETHLSRQEEAEVLHPPGSTEENDPLETINRGILSFNETLDMILIDPLANMYKDLVPEFARERVAYVLRNLGEPIVFANNLLQGELEEARGTLGRFVVNSTLGLGGLFDVSTDLGLPYKKEDFGLTLAAWGLDAGPYLVLPILGPSSARDAWGRIGDYFMDPINWWAFHDEREAYSFIRTGVQILDAKTDNLELMEGLRKNAIDYYATIRAWYTERRRDLARNVHERVALDTPRPDDEDE